MIINNPEYREEVTHYSWGDDTREYVILPKGLPGKRGETILMISNLKYFLEMFTPSDVENYLRPYEILAKLEKQVMEDALNGEIGTIYLAGYKRDPMRDGDVIFEFSHLEINTETEPDEDYRSLYIYFEYTGSAS